MPIPSIRTATTAETDQAVAVVALAFSTEGIARWLYPDPHQYLINCQLFVRLVAQQCIQHASAHITDDYSGAALWLPPGVSPGGEEIWAVLERTVAEPVRGVMGTLSGQMAHYHPSQPYWYLWQIGVDPARQGQGLGAALLEHALVAIDRAQQPAYLETVGSKNISFYQRHGFDPLAELQASTSPTIVPMLRKAIGG